MQTNSKEYWNNRFETDWLDFAGDKQTSFFASILCDMLPTSLVDEVMSNEYTVCDMGCALGEGIPIFSRKLGVDVDGMDFSEQAIALARESYPQSNFWVGNLFELDCNKTYDVLICSNVLEHFINPWKIFRNMATIANKYIIIMVPYKETLKISEHVYYFSESVIPVHLSGFSLDYVRTVDGKNVADTYYPDQQILLIYKRGEHNFLMLGGLTDGIVSSVQNSLTAIYQEEKDTLLKNWEKEKKQYSLEIERQAKELDEKIKESEILSKSHECEILDKEKKIQEFTLKLSEKEDEINTLKQTLDENKIRINSLEQNLHEIEMGIANLEQNLHSKEIIVNELTNTLHDKELLINELKKQLQDSNTVPFETLEATINKLQYDLQRTEQISLEREKAIYKAKANCVRIDSKLSYKFLCAIIRFAHQFVLGPSEEKKKFLGICKSFLKGEKNTFSRNDGYNMVLNIANMLEIPSQVSTDPLISPAEISDISINDTTVQTPIEDVISPHEISSITKSCLLQTYEKPDIIIFSVINYDFRYQRPQHFASRFAQNGHRVFYINANFVNKERINELNNNLYIVDFFNEFCNAIYYAPEWPDFLEWFKTKMSGLIKDYAIRDSMIILDYPNWIYGAEYLRHTYGFKIIVDYMDDFTGFLGTTTDVLKDNCIHMLKSSDLIIASSQFLYDIAIKYTSTVSIVRNGTEVEHFLQASRGEHRKRPVIGYYGAVAHWFAWEKVCYVAEKMPECDIVIIGEVTEYKEKLEKYSNIKLLGEKNYKELPKHLAYFDVCLIPFDTSTDLIKATNPVKFYEYLSAGKRIVATEIPELAPFQDEFVYMSNDNQKFLEYVKMCIEGKDTLKSKKECIAFAKENDWQKRYERFAQACTTAVPKVSVVVLTYNNLHLNKFCVNSILTKTAYPNYELIILDNQSTDGTVEFLKELEKEKDPRIKIIFNSENSGFAGGNNKAIESSSGEYVMLLNNDTIVTRGWLTNAVKHLENDMLCGMCGAVTNSIGNEAMIAVNYHTLNELDCFAYLYTSIHNNQIYTNVDRLAMFCTLIRKSIMDEYGLLDTNYQVGMFEDDDYAKVIEKAGNQFYIAEDVFVHHVNNASFKKLEAEMYNAIFENNKTYFENKWNTKWHMPKYRDGVTSMINEGMMVEPISTEV